MSKKSASTAKVIKPEFKPQVDPVEEFEKFKQLQIITMEAAIDQSKRIDTWMAMRNDLGKFYNRQPELGEVTFFYNRVKNLLEDMLKVLEGLTYEQASDPAYEDIYAGFLITPEECETENEFFEAYLVWCTVKPWAENLFDLNRACVNGNAE